MIQIIRKISIRSDNYQDTATLNQFEAYISL